MAVGGVFVLQVLANSVSDYQSNTVFDDNYSIKLIEYPNDFSASYTLNNLEDFTYPLKKIGLQFVDPSSYPHRQGVINPNSIHIGRIHQDTPILIYSEVDVNLILRIIETAVNHPPLEEAGAS